MEEYNPKPLSTEPNPSVAAIGPRMEDKTVVFIVGAGVSMGPPTNLPSATQLAQSVKTILRTGPLSTTITLPPEDSLLAVADAIERDSPEAFPLFIRAILETADFKMAPPNYAHLVIALLLSEANVQILSTNWDTCIERCSPSVYRDISGCFDRNGLQTVGDNTIFIKLHGCAKDESSICVSSRQIAEETWWATHQVGAALETSLVVFLGIGSIAKHIETTLQKIISMTKDLSNVVIVDPELATDWSQLLKDEIKNHMPMRSEEFLDDILRTLTLSQMSKVNLLAQDIHKELPSSDIDVIGEVREISKFLSKYPAHYIWLWVRRGFFDDGRNSSILDPTFRQFILALALINSVSPLHDMGIIGDTSFMRCRDFTVEIAWGRDPSSSTVLCRKKLNSLMEAKKKSLLPQAQRFVILAHGFAGGLPARIMKESIVAEPHLADIINGSEAIGATWISLMDLMQARDNAQIRTLLFGS